jgi:F420-dependent oxidoreductase-like protein
MRLGIVCGYAGMGLGEDTLALVQEAERLGYVSAWVAEAYGSDAPTVLAWLAAQTTTIGLGAGVMQIPARTPAMTAMTAATLDTLSGGRFLLGLGVSGPQVSEGWHGVRFGSPLSRTREYVDVVRMALRREPVVYAGVHHTLPLPDGPGKALRLTLRPPRPDLPVYLAAVGPKNLRLAGEIADGWLAVFFSPEHAADHVAQIRAGRESSGRGAPADPLAGFDIVATVPVVLTDDLEAGRAALADYTALYLGGMGSRTQNFYNALARRMGFDEAAQRIQDLYLDGRPREAAAAVPLDLVDATALIGPPERIAARIGRYLDAGVTTLAVAPYARTPRERAEVLRMVADATRSEAARVDGASSAGAASDDVPGTNTASAGPGA